MYSRKPIRIKQKFREFRFKPFMNPRAPNHQYMAIIAKITVIPARILLFSSLSAIKM